MNTPANDTRYRREHRSRNAYLVGKNPSQQQIRREVEEAKRHWENQISYQLNRIFDLLGAENYSRFVDLMDEHYSTPQTTAETFQKTAEYISDHSGSSVEEVAEFYNSLFSAYPEKQA